MASTANHMKIGILLFSESGELESANRRGIYSDELTYLSREIIRSLEDSHCADIVLQQNAKIQVIKDTSDAITLLSFDPSKSDKPEEHTLTAKFADKQDVEAELTVFLEGATKAYFEFYSK